MLWVLKPCLASYFWSRHRTVTGRSPRFLLLREGCFRDLALEHRSAQQKHKPSYVTDRLGYPMPDGRSRFAENTITTDTGMAWAPVNFLTRSTN